jgi:putative endopeptidase
LLLSILTSGDCSGFDSRGAKFNAQGQRINWWAEKDFREFNQRTQKLAEQFNGYEPIPGHKINGQLTLGENIADLCGLTIAFDAYKRSKQDQKESVMDGFTGAQRFFIGYAQMWAEIRAKESLQQQILTDFHSPHEYRVNGVVYNVDAFYKAFGVGPKNKRYIPPEKRVKIW